MKHPLDYWLPTTEWHKLYGFMLGRYPNAKDATHLKRRIAQLLRDNTGTARVLRLSDQERLVIDEARDSMTETIATDDRSNTNANTAA